MSLPICPSTFFIALFSSLLISCSALNAPATGTDKDSKKADNLFIVDCLLPGQVRKLGQQAMYLTARRPIKTTASECEIRGGEYVAYDRADFRTSLKVWLPQAKAGNADAQAYVGEIYEKGLGVPPDYKLAKQWYEKAAAQDNTKAQLNLGFLYEKGLGVTKNLPTAMSWYQKASGLAETDIPYAATLNSSAENSELKTEIKLLKAALNNSRQETKRLNTELEQTQQQITRQQISLNQSISSLSQYKNQLNTRQLDSHNAEIAQLQSMIARKEATVHQQKAALAKVQSDYNEQLNTLDHQLAYTQKRAEQINSELLKHQSTSNTAQQELLTTEALLAQTQAQLLNIQQQSQQQLQSIRSENVRINEQFDTATSHSTHKLELSQQALIQLQKHKLNQEILLSQLRQANTRYQGNISQLKSEIKAANLSTARQESINKELTDYKRAANNAGSQIFTLRQRLEASTQQLSSLKSSSEAALTTALADKTNNSELQQQKIKQLQSTLLASEQRIANFAAKWQQQQTLTQQLITEKDRYQSELNSLNKSISLASINSELSVEIIDPPMTLVRGTPTISLRSIVKHREIFGKVTTSSGLLSLLVNDLKTTTDSQGLFQANIKLARTENPVNIVAIDKSGKRANLEFILSLDKARKMEGSTTTTLIPKSTEIGWEKLDFGQYHALIIGNNHYQKVPSLDTPINDAKAVEQVLNEHYAFASTQLLLDATRYEILSALNKLRSQLTEDDNLLIYYAGHGELDKTNMRGHWLPVDADADNTANWISTVAITDILNSMTARHVLVVSDSCYSGAMTRSSLSRIEAGASNPKKQQWLKAMLKTRSRTVLTSGGLKPVMDGGGGSHSVFAKAFIDTLRNNTGLLEGQNLYREVAGNIIGVASRYGIDQVPEYAPIRHAGHESGEFFLVPKIGYF